MTNQTPESVIDDSVVEAAYRAFCEARMGRALSENEHDALRSRLELTWIKPTIAAALRAANMLRESAVPDAATEVLDAHKCHESAERAYARTIRAEAERDAALAAIEWVRVLHEFDEGYCKSCEIPFHECAIATALEAALDGAPEPEEKP